MCDPFFFFFSIWFIYFYVIKINSLEKSHVSQIFRKWFIYLFVCLVGWLFVVQKKKKKVSHSFLYSTCGFIYLFIFFLLLLLLILKCSFINCKVFFMQFISTHAALFLTSICHTLIYAHFSPDFFPPYDLFIFYVKYLYTIHSHFFSAILLSVLQYLHNSCLSTWCSFDTLSIYRVNLVFHVNLLCIFFFYYYYVIHSFSCVNIHVFYFHTMGRVDQDFSEFVCKCFPD